MSEEKIEISKELLSEIIGLFLAKSTVNEIGGDNGIECFLSSLSSNVDIAILFYKLQKEYGEGDDTFTTVDKDAHAYARRINDTRIRSYLVESANFLLTPPLLHDFDQLYDISKERAEEWKKKHEMTGKELVEFLESNAVKETIRKNSRKAVDYLQNVKDFESRLGAFKRKLETGTTAPF